MSAVHLVVLAVADLEDADEWFRCEPYSCSMRAATCLNRQHVARTKGKRSSRGGDRNWAHTGGQDGMTKYWRCRSCPLGETVARQLDVTLPALPARASWLLPFDDGYGVTM